MAGDIVPIELGLTDGDLVTLWAPRWREGDDEWEAFLGHGDDLYAFPTVAQLVAFVRSGADNDLVEHPAWPVVSKLAAVEFEPESTRSFDLIGVPELAAVDADPVAVSELQDTFDIVSILGDVCELDAVTKFFERPEIDAVLRYGVAAFEGRDGADLWNKIGVAVAEDWDAVVDALDAVVTTPAVDEAVVAEIESELVATDENVVEADDTVEDVDDDDEYEYVDNDDDFWDEVGIDPIKIITTDGTWFTLRCYLDDDAVFLGADGLISVFGSERAVARYLADHHDHDLATLETYDEIRHAATDGSLEITVTEDNVYVLTGIADDIAEGITAVDPEQLELGVELFTDAANYAGDDSTDAALAGSTELGLFVNFVLEPDPGRLEPSPPFEREALAWRELEREFEARLRKH
ncbi:primosomal protein [Rhodococcus chondri]|uniref:Primosomal protein n=1 Tax=Rhodococcus chondri TaxID=3065941 RepID=A0ABU7K1F9_9NOCA|nr:primosomal protein [Rhodococcus sp. CC-R104]MEE2035382.1 primosomal protein [Rhodococcus sp. CC-R104]